jgi:hypothetical protein
MPEVTRRPVKICFTMGEATEAACDVCIMVCMIDSRKGRDLCGQRRV